MAVYTPRTDNPEDNMWRQLKYQNATAINAETMHTRDIVLRILKEHLTNVIQRTTLLKIKDVEVIDEDTGRQRIHKSTSDRLNKSSELPRAVMVTLHDDMKEPLVNIPSTEHFYRQHTNLQSEVFTIRSSDSGKDNHWNGVYDLNMSLGTSYRYETFSLSYSILIPSRVYATEVIKILQHQFPQELPLPFYKTEKKMGDDYVNVPYELESVIPDTIIKLLKKTLKIEKDEDLNTFFKKWSQTPIDYKVYGFRQEYRFFNKFLDKIYVKRTSINSGDPVRENGDSANYFIVQIIFDVTYLEHIAYKLSTSCKYLNPDYKGYKDAEFEYPVRYARFSDQVSNCTRRDVYEIIIDKSDIEEYYTEDSIIPKYRVKLSFDDAIQDHLFSGYLDYLYSVHEIDELTNYFNFEVVRAKRHYREKGDDNTGTSPGIIVDYENCVILDPESKEDDKLWIALFINFDDFNKWKVDNGILDKKNLSTK